MQADKNRTEREFSVGDWVFLRLQPYRQTSVEVRTNMKLAPRFYGPYEVLKRIGPVAYKLALPPTSRIHPVFHVSCLKKQLGPSVPLHSELPPLTDDGYLHPEPEEVLDRRMIKTKNQAVTELLIKWRGLPHEDATWELWQTFPSRHEDMAGLRGRQCYTSGNIPH
ncbi:uncharacterized protein LOC143888840 [Tasmannia lanceolata]|uniref:uncharacterized protein LOC143888840 n=1 Tax=Tasmannia lanceolata TaxID=3420 RepID=UPI0040628D0A